MWGWLIRLRSWYNKGSACNPNILISNLGGGGKEGSIVITYRSSVPLPSLHITRRERSTSRCRWGRSRPRLSHTLDVLQGLWRCLVDCVSSLTGFRWVQEKRRSLCSTVGEVGSGVLWGGDGGGGVLLGGGGDGEGKLWEDIPIYRPSPVPAAGGSHHEGYLQVKWIEDMNTLKLTSPKVGEKCNIYKLLYSCWETCCCSNRMYQDCLDWLTAASETLMAMLPRNLSNYSMEPCGFQNAICMHSQL